MTQESVKKAQDAARIFNARARNVLASEEAKRWGGHIYTGAKQTGALRRASMELTRALAEMRKA
jgi:hypothetical protein